MGLYDCKTALYNARDTTAHHFQSVERQKAKKNKKKGFRKISKAVNGKVLLHTAFLRLGGSFSQLKRAQKKRPKSAPLREKKSECLFSLRKYSRDESAWKWRMQVLGAIIFGALISSLAMVLSIRYCYDNDHCCLCCYDGGHTKGERLPQTSVYVRDLSLDDGMAGEA